MLQHVLVCTCGEVLVKSHNETTKVRSRILIFKGDIAYAVCKGCGAEIPAPVKLDKVDLLVKSKNLKLFLKERSSK
jgi:hypothetical protein